MRSWDLSLFFYMPCCSTSQRQTRPCFHHPRLGLKMGKRAGPSSSPTSSAGKKVKASSQRTSSWATSVIQAAKTLMEEGKHPAEWVSERLGTVSTYHSSITCFMAEVLAASETPVLMPTMDMHPIPKATLQEPIRVPLQCLLLKLPSSGPPYFIDWFHHLEGIVSTSLVTCF